MNFLAHLHLSHPNKDEMVGNFIGDYVKGRNYQSYPIAIAKGIVLHRRIDSFTDSHDIHRKSRKLFRDDYGLYSGIICDMTFDFLLAKYWDKYEAINLNSFSESCYQILYKQHTLLPERVQGFLPKMKAAKRLQSYATLEGINQSLLIMSRYTSLPNAGNSAMNAIQDNLANLEQDFHAFYVDLQRFVKEQRTFITDDAIYSKR